jgi:hypothetical protein
MRQSRGAIRVVRVRTLANEHMGQLVGMRE